MLKEGFTLLARAAHRKKRFHVNNEFADLNLDPSVSGIRLVRFINQIAGAGERRENSRNKVSRKTFSSILS